MHSSGFILLVTNCKVFVDTGNVVVVLQITTLAIFIVLAAINVLILAFKKVTGITSTLSILLQLNLNALHSVYGVMVMVVGNVGTIN